MKKKTTEEFIEDSIKIHGDKYDYSLVEYKTAIIKVKIICKEHGVFEQTPNSHSKCGCIKCGGRYSNQDIFLKKAQEIHGDKYDYSLVNYTTATTKVKIICATHGIFEQIPNSHLCGCGCLKCGINKTSSKQTMSQADLISKCNTVHNNKFDYSLIDYKNCKIKVKIICPEHGVFEQSPDHHSRGIGCPECSKYYGNFNDKFLYIFYDYKYNLMKIGASKDPKQRLKEISKGKDRTGLKILKIYEKCANMERKIHIKYEMFRTNHILYEDGSSEWFNLPDSEIYKIDDIISQK